MVVEFFLGSDETLKVAKNYDIGFVGWSFCSSEEPSAANACVHFRVIISFKLLHRKGLDSAKVPEVTQKLALLQNDNAASTAKSLTILSPQNPPFCPLAFPSYKKLISTTLCLLSLINMTEVCRASSKTQEGNH